MDLHHTFTVPTAVEETWAHFQDIASVAECFPGATVSEADGDSFAGSVKVKLGPIALVYNGSGTFVDKDEAAHTFRVEAKGKDKRGNGTAGAKVLLTMADGSDGGTDVEVTTDLAITGKPAQFGRGVMQDVSDKLLGQFVGCLEQRLSGGAGGSGAGSEAPAEPEAVVEPTPIADEIASGTRNGTAAAAPAAAPAAAAAPRSVAAPAASAGTEDSLDLGATVLPVLARTYGPQLLGGLAVAGLITWLLRRRR